MQGHALILDSLWKALPPRQPKRERPARWPLVGLATSLALHALVFALVMTNRLTSTAQRVPAVQEPPEVVLYLRATPPLQATLPPMPAVRSPMAPAAPAVPVLRPATTNVTVPEAPRQPASMAAPPAPSAEQWAFASSYPLKNSKGYRHTWGQQVRSMMGTVVEGPDQGLVRFRIEIAPDGTLTRLETLWSTSPVAERLARQAIDAMPQWPRTPTGKPLIFERTIAFSPFATDDPPVHHNDCLPDRPAFRNSFAWDGEAAFKPAQAQPVEEPDAQALEDCLKQLPKDSIEAEVARDRRAMERWGWRSSTLGQ